jgi:hypothetical protein
VHKDWLGQICHNNSFKSRNFGFKFWVEYPTAYCNNFIIVKAAAKKRTWLSWLDFDPYEERNNNNPIYQLQTVDNPGK